VQLPPNQKRINLSRHRASGWITHVVPSCPFIVLLLRSLKGGRRKREYIPSTLRFSKDHPPQRAQ
jgi:hypothetical protein